MKTTLKMQFVSMALAAMAVLIPGADALANDPKTYSGINCVEELDTTPEIQYLTNGGARNAAAGTNVFICPVIRDNVLSSMDIATWSIVVNRNSSTTDWIVTLFSRTLGGTGGTVNTIVVPAGSGDQLLTGGSILTASPNGQVYVYTVIPSGAELISYFVEETT